jgi:hypothetical protein
VTDPTTGEPVTDPTPSVYGDVIDLDPVDAAETDSPPTGAPPDDWEG